MLNNLLNVVKKCYVLYFCPKMNKNRKFGIKKIP